MASPPALLNSPSHKAAWNLAASWKSGASGSSIIQPISSRCFATFFNSSIIIGSIFNPLISVINAIFFCGASNENGTGAHHGSS